MSRLRSRSWRLLTLCLFKSCVPNAIHKVFIRLWRHKSESES